MTLPRLAVFGMGKMGSSMALRLREQGHAISVWNRSRAKAEHVREQALPGACTVAASAAEAIEAAAPNPAVLMVLSNTDACFEVIDGLGSKLSGCTVVNLTSGSPDDGRQVAAALKPTGAKLIDGAYCGPPFKARAGSGVLFVSADPEADEVDRWSPQLGDLGELCHAGPIGASRALDYAVVDLAFSCYASLMSNVEMLEREGVQPAQLHEHVSKRLQTTPGALEMLYGRLVGERSDAAYLDKPSITVATLYNWWSGRIPYFEARGIPTDWARYMAELNQSAAGGPQGALWDADVSRQQEVMRPPPGASGGSK